MKRFLVFLAIAWLVPGVAHAEPSDADRATARSLAHEGLDAQQHGQYAVAADRFSRADALVHAPTLLLGLARAEVGLGLLVAAHETYERILREPLPPHSPAVFGKAVEEVKHELAALAPRLAWVTIRVDGATSPRVTIDDVPVPVAALGVRRPCDPGSHTVKASAPGFAAADSAFVVGEAGEQTVKLSMATLPEQPPPPPLASAPLQAETAAPLRTKLATVSFGLGGAALITGGAAGIWVLAKHSSLQSVCTNGCPSSESGELYTYRTVANVSTAALIVAGVCAATGVTLLLSEPRANPVSAYVGPMSAGVIGTF
jgi:hypothetical protein